MTSCCSVQPPTWRTVAENVYAEWCPYSNLLPRMSWLRAGPSNMRSRAWCSISTQPRSSQEKTGRARQKASSSEGRSLEAFSNEEKPCQRRSNLAEVRRLLNQGAQLVEVPAADEYKEDHLPGAISLPLRRIEGAKPPLS